MNQQAGGSWVGPLFATVALQASVGFMTRVLLVMGPVLTARAGVSHEQVGQLASIVMLGTLTALVGSGPIQRAFGPVRVQQIATLTGAVGLLMLLFESWPLMVFAALLIGLSGGPSNPAGSEILVRVTPPARRGIIFSIRQAGFPGGGVLAALLLPGLVMLLGLRATLVFAFVFALLAIPATQPWRRQFDLGRGIPLELVPRPSFLRRAFLSPFAILWSDPTVLRLGLAGFGLSMAQSTLFAFQATFLNVEVGLSLAMSGAVFALSQAAGMVGRIAVGWAADRAGSTYRTLVAMSLLSAITMAGTGLITAEWAVSAVAAFSTVTGFAVGTWSGVLLSEIAAQSPPEKVAEATVGVSLLSLIAHVIVPFGLVYTVPLTGSYATAFMLAGLGPLAVTFILLPSARR